MASVAALLELGARLTTERRFGQAMLAAIRELERRLVAERGSVACAVADKLSPGARRPGRSPWCRYALKEPPGVGENRVT